MNCKEEMIKKINRLSGSYASYEVFSDFVKCAALSISNFTEINQGKIKEKREREYLEIMRKYTKEERKVFPELMNLLIDAMEENIEDVLGDVYMSGNMGNKHTGQFFTPFHISMLCARQRLPKIIEKPLEVYEPSAGGGGMIIALVKVMVERGINPQRYLEVTAQDLDWKGVYMTYLQLSILGIKAIVVQGDTLAEPFTSLRDYPQERVFLTPARKGMLIW